MVYLGVVYAQTGSLNPYPRPEVITKVFLYPTCYFVTCRCCCLRPIINYVNLEIYVSRDFFFINQVNLEKKHLEIFGGHLANFFVRLILRLFSRFMFLKIYVLSYTAVNLEIFSIKKSQDFLFRCLWSSFLIIFLIMNHNVDDGNKNKRRHLLVAAVAASFFSSSKGKKLTFGQQNKEAFQSQAQAEAQLSSSLYYYQFQMRLELKFSSARASIIISFK